MGSDEVIGGLIMGGCERSGRNCKAGGWGSPRMGVGVINVGVGVDPAPVGEAIQGSESSPTSMSSSS